MGVSLGKVSQCVASVGCDLFREQSEVVVVLQRTLEVLAGFIEGASAEREIFNGPECAYAERAFGRIAWEAVEQANSGAKFPNDAAISSEHAWRIRRLEAIPGK